MCEVKNAYIYGCNGFALEVYHLLLDVIQVEPKYCFKGFIGDGAFASKDFIKRFKLTKESDITPTQDDCIFLAIGKNLEFKKEISEKFIQKGFCLPNLIHPTSLIKTQNIGYGNIITAFCSISEDAIIGNCNLLNGYNGIGHNASIGNFNTLSSHTNILGNATIDSYNHFSTMCSMLPKSKIGSHNIIAPATVIYKSFQNNRLIRGNPATGTDKFNGGGGINDLFKTNIFSSSSHNLLDSKEVA